jgi:hypothetical protein
MQHTQDLIGSEDLIGHDPHKERRDDCAKRRRSGHNTYLLPIEVQRAGKPRRNGYVPRAPDKILQKHHGAQTNLDL